MEMLSGLSKLHLPEDPSECHGGDAGIVPAKENRE